MIKLNLIIWMKMGMIGLIIVKRMKMRLRGIFSIKFYWEFVCWRGSSFFFSLYYFIVFLSIYKEQLIVVIGIIDNFYKGCVPFPRAGLFFYVRVVIRIWSPYDKLLWVVLNTICKRKLNILCMKKIPLKNPMLKKNT